jgi:hypothetical protein
MTDKKQPSTSSDNEQVAVPPPKNNSGNSNGNNGTLKIILIIVGVVIFLGLLAVAVFSWLFKETVDKVTDNVDISQEDGSFEVRSQDGESEFELNGGDTKQLPDDFPSQVTLIEPYTIQSSSRTKIGERRSWNVSFELEGQPQANFDSFVETYSQDDRWEETSQVQSDGIYNVTYTNQAEDLVLSVNFSSDSDDQTDATFSVINDPEQG